MTTLSERPNTHAPFVSCSECKSPKRDRYFMLNTVRINFAAVTILALGVALYQAWKQTDGQGLQLALRGPFRIGEGPIAAR